MNQKIYIIFGAVILLVGGSAFYGGMKFQQSRGSGFVSPADFRNLQNLSPEERQARMQQLGGGNGGLRGGQQRNNGGFVSGEVISKDDNSFTVKLQDGGSKIIFFASSTEVTKFTNGSLDDLEIGKNIIVNGATNSDGSVTAQTIQLRPLAR